MRSGAESLRTHTLNVFEANLYHISSVAGTPN
jgi:hypothetical protein